jgi:uncharacterized protein
MKDFKEHIGEVIKLKKTPHSIALGFAIGTFIAILPTLGIGIFIALLVALVYPKVSKISLFGSFLVWNPFILVPLYALSYTIGNLIYTGIPMIEQEGAFLTGLYNVSREFFLGNIIVSGSIAVLSYFILKHVIKVYKKKIKFRI